MKLAITLSAISIAALCGTAAWATPANAQTGDWSLQERNNGVVLFTSAIGTPGLVYACDNEGNFTASFNLDGEDMMAKSKRNSKRYRIKSGTLDIAGRDASSDKWVYMPGRQTAHPRSKIVSRRLYNAAVTGSEVSLSLKNGTSVTVTPPPINEEFKTFAKTCSATS